MLAAWQIARKDLSLRIRDRSAIVLGVVTPLVLAFIFNAIFGGVINSESVTTLGFADLDGGQATAGLQSLVDTLDAEEIVDVATFVSEAELRTAVDEGDVAAGLLAPSGVSDAVLAGRPAELVVIGEVGAPTSASIARGIAEAYSSSVADVQAAIQASLALGADPGAIQQIAETGAAAPTAVSIGQLEAANAVLDPTTFFAASMAVFFVFFTVQFGVTGLLDEQREGTLTRLQAAPIPRWAVIFGKALSSVLLGLTSLIILAVATTLLMGADWGNPVQVIVLMAATVISATAILGVVAALARTPEGAGNVSSIIAVALGMLGGTFIPVGGGNRIIELLSRLTPHQAFLRGLGEIRAESGWGGLGIPLATLAGFVVVIGALAALLLRKRYA